MRGLVIWTSTFFRVVVAGVTGSAVGRATAEVLKAMSRAVERVLKKSMFALSFLIG
jgi:hypothetical protein